MEGEEEDRDESRQRRDVGLMQHGCAHYKRRCRIKAPCCDRVFDCRHCHNEAMNQNEKDPDRRHDLPRHKVKLVICRLCGTEQEVRQICKSCGVCMGEYFCTKCKFFDDDTSKAQYHCDACGICRVGGKEKFFHCNKCGCCYSMSLQSGHACVENSMHQNCPVCFDYLFDSITDITVMPCGHTIHSACLQEMYNHSQFTCPVCSKSICDMSGFWEQLDEEIAATPMPDVYRDKMVWILCNDCSSPSQADQGRAFFLSNLTRTLASAPVGLLLLLLLRCCFFHSANNKKQPAASPFIHQQRQQQQQQQQQNSSFNVNRRLGGRGFDTGNLHIDRVGGQR